MSKRLAKKVLLIGWDAADWKVINPLMDAGLMPTLQQLVNGGVIANLATLDPPLSPILWTSIATGKMADDHGILGFVEPDADTMEIRPVSSRSRKVKAIWNILTQNNLKANVVGWWPSHPAEPINGVCVSNFYQKADAPFDKPWEMAKGTVHPASLEATLKDLRVHPAELTMAHILPFIPNAEKIDQEKDKRMSSVAKILAHAASIHSAATHIMRTTEWDFMAVYYDSIDHFCHGFMKFHPPQQKGIPDELYENYKDVVNAGYRFHDMMLERLLQLAGDDTTVILMSDHGFHSDHLRPKRIPKEPAGPAYEHSPYGIFCINGQHIQKDERIYGASLLDITPTLLTLFGLPIGKDMMGKPLVQAFAEPVQPDYIDSWENVPGESGMLPSDMREDPWAAKEAMNQLVELGYIEKPGEDKEKNLKRVVDESQYYLARVLIFKKKFKAASDILETLHIENPANLRYGLSLLTCYESINNIALCRKLIEELRTTEDVAIARLDLVECNLLLAEHKPKQALALLQKLEERSSHLPWLHIQIGKSYQRLKRWTDAEQAFRKAIELDMNNANAYQGLSLSLLRQGFYEEAAETALDAIGLLYHFPLAHYQLGEALYYLAEYEQAAKAWQVSVNMQPTFRRAHQWLIRVYRKNLNNEALALEHEKIIMEKIKGTITVVSGLPRSGTSMLMQMLKAGGMDILTDNQRKEDDNNPHGYLEYEKVKSLITDKSWLGDAADKAVKIVVPLLMQLPDAYQYKIIFMHRNMDELLRSQQKMLGHHRAVRENAYPVMLAEAFKKQLEKTDVWLKAHPNADVLHINYADVIKDPLTQAQAVCAFLDEELDLEKMATAVDATLYRTKTVEG